MPTTLKVKSPSTGWILLGILAVGTFLRCYSIHHYVWIDELHTAWCVAGDYFDLVQRARLGNNMPTYFLLVKLVTDLFGLHAWSLRLLSIVAGCTLIPLVYGLSKSWRCTTTASLLAAALVAVDRTAIFYSVEARAYVFVQLFSVLHLFLFSRLLVRSHVWIWIAWVLTGIAMFYLHCTSALIFPAEVIAYFAARGLKHESKSHVITLAVGIAVIALGMIPSLTLLSEVAARRENWAMFIRRSRNPFDIVTLLPMYVYLLAPIVIAIVAFAAKRLRTSLSMEANAIEEDFEEEDRPADPNAFVGLNVPLAITGCWLFVPLILSWIATERDIARLFFPRYLVAASVTLAPMSALLMSRLLPGKRMGKWGSVLVLLIAVCTISPVKNIFRYGSGVFAHSGESWRDAVDIINQSDTEIPLILYSGLIEADAWHDSPDDELRAYCEFPVRGLYPIATDRKVIALAKNKPTITDVESQAISPQGAWLLIRATDKPAAKIHKEITRLLGKNCRTSESHKVGRIHLKRLVLTRSSEE